MGTTQEFDSINPHLAFLASSAEAVNLQYDVLVGLGPKVDYVPTGFAESWVRDGATWTFTIRDGMRWSDGHVADAGDVAFTFQYLLASMDPAYIGPWAPSGNDLPDAGTSRPDGVADGRLSLHGDVPIDGAQLTSVRLIDDRTVALTTAEPTTLLLGASTPILPEHIWSSVTFSQALTDFQSGPPVIGSGPFQVVDWHVGRSATFGRNDRYWGRPPFPDQIRFRFYEEEEDLVEALQRGDVDYARGIPNERFAELDGAPDVVGLAGLGTGFTHLAFNTYAAPIDGGGASTSAVRDRRFRDALGYAIDNQTLIDEALDGYGTPGTTLIPPFVVPFHAEPTRPRAYDPAEARQRLTDAGYVDTDADGVREDRDGKPIELRLFYPTGDATYAIVARAVGRDWERIGVGVTSTALDRDTLAELMYVPEAGGIADYDIVLWGWAGSQDPDFLLSLLTTSQIGGWSDSNHSDPAYDRLFGLQRRAPTVEARQTIVREMLDLAYDAAPYHVLFYADELHAHRTDRFQRWTVPPRDGGVSLFTYGVEGYLDLVPATRVATPTPSPAVQQPSSVPIPTPSAEPRSGPLVPLGLATPLLTGILATIVALGIGLIASRIRRRAGP